MHGDVRSRNVLLEKIKNSLEEYCQYRLPMIIPISNSLQSPDNLVAVLQKETKVSLASRTLRNACKTLNGVAKARFDASSTDAPPHR